MCLCQGKVEERMEEESRGALEVQLVLRRRGREAQKAKVPSLARPVRGGRASPKAFVSSLKSGFRPFWRRNSSSAEMHAWRAEAAVGRQVQRLEPLARASFSVCPALSTPDFRAPPPSLQPKTKNPAWDRTLRFLRSSARALAASWPGQDSRAR